MRAQQVHLIKRPKGAAKAADIKLVETELPALQEGEVYVRNAYMSVDPYMLGRMQGSIAYTAPFELNEVMEGEAVGEVIESKNPDFPVGAYVQHWFGWRDIFLGMGESLRIINPPQGVPLEAYLDILGGTTGLAAYAGLFYIADLQPGENVFVSGAAGAVGAAVCQMALALDCHVVGSAGSDTKIRWLEDEIGIYKAINYRAHETSQEFEAALAEVMPNGIDVYFENVGGKQLEAALWLMNNYGRIPLCGMIEYYETEYNTDRSVNTGPHNFIQIADRWLKVQGLHAPHYKDRTEEFEERICGFITAGKIRSQTTIVRGLGNSLEALNGLFTGQNLGKMLVAL